MQFCLCVSILTSSPPKITPTSTHKPARTEWPRTYISVNLLTPMHMRVCARAHNCQQPMHVACYHGHADAIRLLLNKGADPDLVCRVYSPPLPLSVNRPLWTSSFPLLASSLASDLRSRPLTSRLRMSVRGCVCACMCVRVRVCASRMDVFQSTTRRGDRNQLR